jgi:hypothetical protein
MRALLFLSCVISVSTLAQEQGNNQEWKVVEQKLGRAGQLSDGVYKVGFPRSDLNVHIGKTRVEPGAGLGTWAAFRKSGEEVIADGDLVVTGAELDGVVSRLQKAGLEVSAIHNHLAGEQPTVYYVHFFGKGSASQLAEAVDSALKATKTPRAPSSSAKEEITYDRALIEKVLGKAGQAKAKVLAISFARSHTISMHGDELPPAMGMATAINFQPAHTGVAATGDYVVRETSVQDVIRALRDHKITVTAVHNHLLEDEPRMVFIHFWAEGPANAVAQGLKAALDASDNAKF